MRLLTCLSLTEINTIVTGISILCTLGSGFFAWRAGKIKNDLVKKLNTVDLIAYEEELRRFTKEFKAETRKSGWNKGKTGNHIITRLDAFIVEWNKVCVAVAQGDTKREISSKISSINQKSKSFTAWDNTVWDSVYDTLLEIDKLINDSINLQKSSF